MSKQSMPIVNASTLLTDAEVINVVVALHIQYDRDFKPAWGDAVPEIEFSFVPMSGIPFLDPASWPIFLNRHSQDPGALGWHTADGKRIYGRVYVGDCIAFGIQWQTDLGHEVLETALDPDATKVWQMANGDLAAYEACDAVEADKFSYIIRTPGGIDVPCTNFVMPPYFSNDHNAPQTMRAAGPYDFRSVLKGPCPDLSEGGYMSILKAGASDYTMIQADHASGAPGRRFLQPARHRRLVRQSALEYPNALQIMG